MTKVLQSVKVDRQFNTYSESIPGSQKYNKLEYQGVGVPVEAVEVFRAERVGKSCTYSAQKREFNPKSYTPGTKYRHILDYRRSDIPIAKWLTMGCNMVSNFMGDQKEDLNNFPSQKQFIYFPESGMWPGYDGYKMHVASLAEMEKIMFDHIPAPGPGAMICFNIETSNNWSLDFFNPEAKNYPHSFEEVADSVTITTEFAKETMTLRQLANYKLGQYAYGEYMDYEMKLRYCNIVGIAMQIAGRNGAKVGFGTSIYQGPPGYGQLNDPNNRALDSGMRVDQIDGYQGNNTIILNGRTYKNMTGSFYQFEGFHLDYHYYTGFDYPGDYTKAQDYFEFWSKVIIRHPFAREIGHMMACDVRLRAVHDGNTIPMVRMTQPYFESGQFVPSQWNAGNQYGAKMDQPPYLNRIIRLASWLYQGEIDFAGFKLFTNYIDHDQSDGFHGNGVIDVKELATLPEYNVVQHAIESIHAAGADFEDYVPFLEDSTRTIDIDFKIGDNKWESRNGWTAYVASTPQPCALTRHKQKPEGLYVMVGIAADQKWEDVRTDTIRIAGIMSNDNNEFEITYKGKDLAVFWFFIPNGVTGKKFIANYNVPEWSRAGYGGIPLFQYSNS